MNGPATDDSPLVTQYTLREAKRQVGGRVLVADDNMVNQKVAVRMLEKLGYRADVVGNGCEAVEAVARLHYDVVLMDCQMPEMDGFEATREIRKREALSVMRDAEHREDGEASSERRDASDEWRLPIIALTANAMKGDREKCLEAGMNDFVTKPIKLEKLEAVLSYWVPKTEEGKECEKHETSLVDRQSSLGNNEIQATNDEIQHPPLNTATLEELRGLGGDDPTFFSEIVQQFLKDGPGHVTAIRQAVANREAENLMRATHTFKGSCWNMGAMPLGELCFTLEQKGRAGEAENLNSLLTELENEYARVQMALEAELIGLPTAFT